MPGASVHGNIMPGDAVVAVDGTVVRGLGGLPRSVSVSSYAPTRRCPPHSACSTRCIFTLQNASSSNRFLRSHLFQISAVDVFGTSCLTPHLPPSFRLPFSSRRLVGFLPLSVFSAPHGFCLHSSRAFIFSRPIPIFPSPFPSRVCATSCNVPVFPQCSVAFPSAFVILPFRNPQICPPRSARPHALFLLSQHPLSFHLVYVSCALIPRYESVSIMTHYVGCIGLRFFGSRSQGVEAGADALI